MVNKNCIYQQLLIDSIIRNSLLLMYFQDNEQHKLDEFIPNVTIYN